MFSAYHSRFRPKSMIIGRNPISNYSVTAFVVAPIHLLAQKAKPSAGTAPHLDSIPPATKLHAKAFRLLVSIW
jgi:hypothetical protein